MADDPRKLSPFPRPALEAEEKSLWPAREIAGTPADRLPAQAPWAPCRPLWAWVLRGEPADPTEEEKADAIQCLREQGDLLSWAESDWPVVLVYRAAERCFAAGAS